MGFMAAMWLGVVGIFVSFFVIPETYFGSFDDYLTSVLARVVMAIILIFAAWFPSFGKGAVKRYVFFVAFSLVFYVIVALASSYLEHKLGSGKAMLLYMVMLPISFIVMLLADRKNKMKKVVVPIK